MKFELLMNIKIAWINEISRLKSSKPVKVLNHQSQSFILLINVKMPIVVGILTFINKIDFMLSRVKHEKSFITLGPRADIDEDLVLWMMTKIYCYNLFIMSLKSTTM